MTTPVITLELTAHELTLIENALRSFMSDFGHDEADVLDAVRQLIDKVAAARTDGELASTG